MEKLEGVITYAFYFNSQYAQMAFWLKPTTFTDPARLSEGYVKCVGKNIVQQKNLPVLLEGGWKEVGGKWEFHFSKISLFSSNETVSEFFLNSLDIPSTQKDRALFLKLTGANIFQTEGMEDRLPKGADAYNISQMILKIRNLVNQIDTFEEFQKYNGTYEHVIKTIRKFPENTVGILRTDPYRIYAEGTIPFSVADRAAKINGILPTSEDRIKAILLFCIRKQTNAGNVCITFDDLCRDAAKIQGDIPGSAIAAALAKHEHIIKDSKFDVYYEKVMYADECLASKEFIRLMRSKKALPWHPEYIDEIERMISSKFGSQQRSAFELLRSTGIKLLTGDPGTGKTTTVNGLLMYLEKLWQENLHERPRIALCAPSGRAAQRMKETTERNALTVHKLLEYQPYGKGEYYKDGSDPIEADIVVVDEVSMLGLSIFGKLLAAIESGSLVILVGDVNQLQSVDPGNVLADVVRSGYVDHCHLTEVFRQSAMSRININAKKVMNGDSGLETGADFELLRSDDPEQTKNLVCATAARLIQESGDKGRVQCLSPIKKSPCGVYELNTSLQALFNDGERNGGIFYGSKRFKVGDRVIMQSNNYALNYYNGDVGIIRHIFEDKCRIQIGEETIELPRENYVDMDLAYCVTIHKSQGSEYDYLVIVLPQDGYLMADQNLLYTAITRGKKKVVIIYEGDTLKKAASTKKLGNRKSLIIERIADLCKAQKSA